MEVRLRGARTRSSGFLSSTTGEREVRWRVSLSCERLNSGEPVLAEIFVDSEEVGDQIVAGLKGADEVVLLIARCKTMALGLWVQRVMPFGT